LQTPRRICAIFFDCTDCKIIMLEVERKAFSLCAQQGHQSLTAFGEFFLNYAILGFCTISTHIMLGSFVPNLRGRG
jgi:hypothetical protein